MKSKKTSETIFVGPAGATATTAQIAEIPVSIRLFYNEGGK